MFRLQLSGKIFRAALVVPLLFANASAANRVDGVSSKASGILLHAVLLQSLSMCADPQPSFFNSFVESQTTRDFPVTIKTNWVRGPGNVSIVVLSGSGWDSFQKEPVAVVAPSHEPAMQIESGSLPFSADNRSEVLTIRAQVI